MAENRTFDQFLVDLRGEKGGAAVGSWEGFSEFLHDAVEKLKEDHSVDVGGQEYEPREFLSYIASLFRFRFFNGQVIKFRPQPDAFPKLRGQFQEWGERIATVLQNPSGEFDEAISLLENSVLSAETAQGFETKDGGEEPDENPFESGAKDALQKLAADVDNHRRDSKKKLEPYVEQRIKGDEPPEEELDNKEDDNAAHELKLQKRKKREEIVVEYRKKLEEKRKELLKKFQEQNRVATVFLSNVEEEDSAFSDALLEALTRRTQFSNDGTPLQLTTIAASLNAYDHLKDAFQFLDTAIQELEKAHKELEALYLPRLAAGATTVGSSTDDTGAEAGERDEDEQPTSVPVDRETIYRQYVQTVREIGTFAYALQPNVAREFAKALGLAGDRDAQKQISDYISARFTALKKILDAHRDDAAEALSVEGFEELILAEVDQLVTVWQAFSQRPEKKDEGNVPRVDTSEAQQQTAAAGTLGQQVASGEEDLSERVRKISRAQHDVLAVAEGELRLKMLAAGLDPKQIDTILDNNRVLLLDTLRYKAFEAASHLKPGETLGQSAILGMIAQEVDTFYIKLSHTNATLARVGLPSPTDVEKLRTQLRDLSQKGVVSLSETEITQIISGFEQSRFQPLVQYFKDTQGYFDGGTQLAQVLTKNGIVRADQVNVLANRLLGGDFAAIMEPALSALAPVERQGAYRRIQEILERAAKNRLQPGDEQYLLAILGRNPRAAIAIQEFFAVHMMQDTYDRMHQLHGLLSKVDKGTSGSQYFRPTSGALAAFAGPSRSAAPQQAVTNYDQISDEDKFMLQVALSTAYQQMKDADPAQRAVLQGEIAVLVHEMYSGGGGSPVVMLEAANADELDAMGASLDPRAPAAVAAGRQKQSANQKFANFARGAMGGGPQSAAASERAQQMQAALKILRTGGNPLAVVSLLLTDKKAREMLMKAVGITAIGGTVGTVALVTSAINAITSIPIIGPLLGSILGLKAAGATTATGASGATGASFGKAVGGEFSRSAANALRDGNTQLAKSVAQNRPALETATKGALNNSLNTATNLVYNTSTATIGGGLVATAILGPFTLISFFTIITITVIGSAMNGYPGQSGLLSNFNPLIHGAAGCWPVEGNITSLHHPAGNRVTAGGSAIDIGATLGNPVYTPFNGTARWKIQRPCSNNVCATTGYAGYGIHVRITTDQGFDIILAHFSAFPDGIANGDTRQVVAGQLVGLNGSTGNSTGPHVHYEVLPSPGGRNAPNIFQILPVPLNQLSNGYATSPTACGAGQIPPAEGAPSTSGSTP